MRSGKRAALVCLIAATSAIASAQQEQSLAERAAAARHASSSVTLSPAATGYVTHDDYINDYFGLKIKHLPRWESLSAGQMNVTEALGREAMGLKAGITGSGSGRVFGMHDGTGSSLFVSVRPLPAGTDLSDLGVKLREAVTTQIPTLQCADERSVFSDRTHKFVAFRCVNHAQDRTFYQDQQAIVTREHLIMLTLTAPTQEQLSALVHQIRANVTWSGLQP